MATPDPVCDDSCDCYKQKSMGEWLLEVDKAIHVPGRCVNPGPEGSGCFCLYCRVTSKIYQESSIICEKIKDTLLEELSELKSIDLSVHPIGSFKSNVKVLACDEFDFLLVLDHRHENEESTKLVLARFKSLMTSLQSDKQKLSSLESSLPGVKFLTLFQHGPAWCFDVFTSHPAKFQLDISLAVRHLDLLLQDSKHEYLGINIFSSIFSTSSDAVIKLNLCPDETGRTMALVQEKLFHRLQKISPNTLVIYRILKVFAALFFPQRVSKHEHAPDGFLQKSFINPHLIKEVLFWQVEQNPDPSYWETEHIPQRLIDILWNVYKMRTEYFTKEKNVFQAITQWIEKGKVKFLCCSNTLTFSGPFQRNFGFLKYGSYKSVLTLEQFLSALPEDGKEISTHLSTRFWDLSYSHESFRSFLLHYYAVLSQMLGEKDTLVAANAEEARNNRLTETDDLSDHFPVLQFTIWTFFEREFFSCFDIDATVTNLLEEKGYISLKMLEALSEEENFLDLVKDNILTPVQKGILRSLTKHLPLNKDHDPKDFLDLMKDETVPTPCKSRFKEEGCTIGHLLKHQLKVLQYLHRYKVLSGQEYADLKGIENAFDLIPKLFLLILDNGGFPSFLQVLKDTNQVALLKLLLDRLSGRRRGDFNAVIDIEMSASNNVNANSIQKMRYLNEDISQSSNSKKTEIASIFEEFKTKVLDFYTGSILITIKVEDEALFQTLLLQETVDKTKECIINTLELGDLARKHGFENMEISMRIVNLNTAGLEGNKHNREHATQRWPSKTDERTSLFEACKNGDIAVLNEVEHPELFRDVEGRPGLHVTIEAGQYSSASLLISKGLDVNLQDNNGSAALHVATINQQIPMINLLVESGANLNLQNKDGETAFLLAVKSGNPDIIKLLHDNQADVNIPRNDGWAPIHFSCREIFCMKKVIKKLQLIELDNSYTETKETPTKNVFSEATLLDMENADVLETLLNMRINPNEQTSLEKTPLSIAAEQGSLLHVTTLLKHGADPSVADNRGWLPIHAAAHRSRADITETLLTAVLYYSVSKHYPHRAPVLNPRHCTNIKTGTGLTPLMLAVRSGSRDCVDKLLKHGADVEMQDAEGMRALHFSCQGNHRYVIELLLKHGAKTDVFNKQEELPVSLTTNRDCSTLIIHHDRRKREVTHSQFDPGETCDICTELLTDPRVLECGHVFCVTCLEKPTSPENSIPCPTCRQVTELLPRLLPKLLPRPSTTLAHNCILLKQVHTWSLDHVIGAVVVDAKRHLVYVGHANTKPDGTGEPISVYTFSGKLVNRIKDRCSYPPVAIDTKRDLIMRARTKGVRTFTTEGELVRTITCPEIKHVSDICYQVCEDRYVVADRDSHCLHFICAATGKVLKSVPAEEARDTTRGGRNVYMGASRSPHSSRLVTTDRERNLVKLYDGEGNFIRRYTGAGSQAGELKWPDGVCFDHQDRILVCDWGHHRLVRISPDTGNDTRSCEVILDTSSLGLGHPRRVEETEEGLLVMGFCSIVAKRPYNIAVFTGYQ